MNESKYKSVEVSSALWKEIISWLEGLSKDNKDAEFYFNLLFDKQVDTEKVFGGIFCWMEKLAVEDSDAQAQCYVGRCYMSGEKAEFNREKGISFLLKSAEQNNAEACYQLGITYEHNKDFEKAYSYYSKAKRYGHESADIALKRIGNKLE